MQQRAERRGLVLHVRKDVRVDLHRHRDRAVPEALADDVDWRGEAAFAPVQTVWIVFPATSDNFR